MEKRIVIDPPKDLQEKYTELLNAFEFVNKSREQKPTLQFIEERKKYLEENHPAEADSWHAVDDFVVRLLATSKDGISNFEITKLVYDGASIKIDMQDIQRAVWDLLDGKILIQTKDRRIKLAPEFIEEVLK